MCMCAAAAGSMSAAESNQGDVWAAELLSAMQAACRSGIPMPESHDSDSNEEDECEKSAESGGGSEDGGVVEEKSDEHDSKLPDEDDDIAVNVVHTRSAVPRIPIRPRKQAPTSGAGGTGPASAAAGPLAVPKVAISLQAVPQASAAPIAVRHEGPPLASPRAVDVLDDVLHRAQAQITLRESVLQQVLDGHGAH